MMQVDEFIKELGFFTGWNLRWSKGENSFVGGGFSLTIQEARTLSHKYQALLQSEQRRAERGLPVQGHPMEEIVLDITKAEPVAGTQSRAEKMYTKLLQETQVKLKSVCGEVISECLQELYTEVTPHFASDLEGNLQRQIEDAFIKEPSGRMLESLIQKREEFSGRLNRSLLELAIQAGRDFEGGYLGPDELEKFLEKHGETV